MSAQFDLTGQRFGRLLVLSKHPVKDKQGKISWLCKCDCNKEKVIYEHNLTRGLTKSCGCIFREYLEAKKARAVHGMIGRTFGKLTILRQAERTRGHDSRWLCKCSCGKEKEFLRDVLLKGKRDSCGCSKITKINPKITHGESNKSVEYRIWSNIKTRCTNSKNEAFPNYGGRGIKMCDRWLSYENFLQDVGRRPASNLTLERIDNDGDYTPENCCWATRKVQANNTRRNARYAYNDKSHTISEWAEILGMSYSTLYDRVKRYKKTIEEVVAYKNK